MKKNYEAPEILVQKIEVSNMICVSGLLDTDTEITTPEGFGSRSLEDYFLGDDEEELFKFID